MRFEEDAFKKKVRFEDSLHKYTILKKVRLMSAEPLHTLTLYVYILKLYIL